MPRAKRILPDTVKFCTSARETIEGADCVLIVTDWDEFKNEELYQDKVVVDGRRALDPNIASQICKHYEGVCW